MKTITSDYKDTVKLFGREIDCKISYVLNNEVVELGAENLSSVIPHYEGGILKSVMKQLDIESDTDIPKDTDINCQFGVKVDDEYEYINLGNYIVYSSEKQEDTNSYKIICYDKMLYSMKPYEDMELTYPITIRNYIKAICDRLNLTFKNELTTFANYDKEIQNELYLDSEGNDLNYTFRDVLDELAQVTASTICINEQTDELEIRYITDSEDTIDEEYLKNVNVNFGEKYGKVNSIVLSRSGESDNVYLSDDESIAENGLCEIKIVDNQIMNWNDRSDYLTDILDQLDGLEYYLNDFSSTGITYYELCDRYNIQVGETTYSCVMFNDEINITQGLEEHVHTDMPEESETDYTKADKTDRRINQTYIIVNKQQSQIESLVSTQTQQGEQLSQVIQNVNSIQNLFQITGGSNLIKNSQGLLDDDVWNKQENGTYIMGYDADLIGKTVAVSKLGISNGKLSTKDINIENLILGNTYTLNYYITNEEDATTTVRLIGNNIIYEKTFDEECEMQDEVFDFVADTSKYVLEIESSSTNDTFVYIYDLMLNSGDKKPWEPSVGEIVGTVIKLSQLGLQIYCTGSNIATLLTAQGFQVRRFQNGQLYEVITEFTDKGITTNQITYISDNMDGLIHKTISSGGYKKYISYVGGGN